MPFHDENEQEVNALIFISFNQIKYFPDCLSLKLVYVICHN
jgi:hypothetical protein